MKLFRIFKRFRLGITLKTTRCRSPKPPSKPCSPPSDREGRDNVAAPRHECPDGAPFNDVLEGNHREDDSDEVLEEYLKRGFLMENKAESGHRRPRLPATILLEILMMCNDHTSITDRRTSIQHHLSNLSLVCKTWCLIVLPMLYREVYLSSSAALGSFLAALKTYPCLRSQVRFFQYYGIWFKSGRAEMSPSEIRNLGQVYSLCSNLFFHSIQRPSDKTLCCDRDALEVVNLNLSGLKKLTRLEVSLPEGMPCKSSLIIPGILVFPALQELVLDVRHRGRASRTSREHSLDWPMMPRLMKLCIKNWHVPYNRFSLPPRADKLRIVELLGGSYINVNDLFGNELSRYARNLESITITAAEVGDVFFHEVNLEEFTSLTEICVPIYPFAITTKFRFPHTLQRLVISGSPETGFKDPWRYPMEFLERKLTEFLECDTGNLIHLSSVRVMLDSPWMTYLEPIIDFARAARVAKARGIKLECGVVGNVERNYKDVLAGAESDLIVAQLAETSQRCLFPSAHKAALENRRLRSPQYLEYSESVSVGQNACTPLI